MASPQSPQFETPGNFRFEFDPANNILMIRFEGRLTHELVQEFYQQGKEYWIATGARAAILDGSAVTQVDLSSDLIRQLARRDPVLELTGKPRVFVVPRTEVFGLARMFQLTGEWKQPYLHVVRTMDQAYALLGIQSATFEPIEDRRAS
ncbi:MAG: STAS domain-containing protein [Candidatus Sulfotelmatobacter sp.]